MRSGLATAATLQDYCLMQSIDRCTFAERTPEKVNLGDMQELCEGICALVPKAGLQRGPNHRLANASSQVWEHGYPKLVHAWSKD